VLVLIAPAVEVGLADSREVGASGVMLSSDLH
jgi:hypothetical protein